MNEEIIEAAIKKYGVVMQTVVAIEEMSELTKELTKALRGKENIEGIVEELADVYIMLNQVQMMFGISDDRVQEMMDLKIQRLDRRIKKGADV